MATVSDERARLQARLSELDDERKQIEYALTVLGRVEEPSRRRKRISNGGPSTVDLAVDLINADDARTWRVNDVIEALEAKGWGANIGDKTSAVRTSLTRALERGLIARLGQGEYVSLVYAPAKPVDTSPVTQDDPWATPAPTATFDEEPPF
jgi:hypothetical protein